MLGSQNLSTLLNNQNLQFIDIINAISLCNFVFYISSRLLFIVFYLFFLIICVFTYFFLRCSVGPNK